MHFASAWGRFSYRPVFIDLVTFFGMLMAPATDMTDAQGPKSEKVMLKVLKYI